MSQQSRAQPGARWDGEGVSFRLYSRHADSVDLCLFNDPAVESARHPLRRTEDDWWDVYLPGIGPGQQYGYRVDGPHRPAEGHRFNPAKLLADPAALALTGEPLLESSLTGADPDDASAPDPRDSAPFVPRSLVVDTAFDWRGDRSPRTPWSQTVLYECHVRGMTRRHPGVPESLRGTYLGLAAEPVIEHLHSLGVTAVELLPVQQIASEPHLLRRGLHNYFGYSPLGFMAPHAGYATASDGRQVVEFKEMVRRLHRAGLEVVLDVVFNHTAEGDHRGPTLSLRGIDNRTYYRLTEPDPAIYEDFTGCGNTLDCRNQAVLDLIVSTLVYWVDEMHVDGFRFDLAAALTRGDSVEGDSPFVERLRQHPSLAAVKLIAEPWDLGPDGYRLGRFPPPWREWNDRFRDTARAFWRGDERTAEPLRRAVAGSPDLFPPPRGALASINLITCHDGFTLEDLVSYEVKHNQDNGEDNRDGHDHNVSRNWGVEGPTTDPPVLGLRHRAKRNLLATLALARGVPMLSHGDEMGRTQFGNNNAYCQDSELTWVDWSNDAESEALQQFIHRAFDLRAEMADAGEEICLSVDGRRLDTMARRTLPLLALFRPKGPGGYLLLFNGTATARLFRLPRDRTLNGELEPIWRTRLASFSIEAELPRKRTVRLPAHALLVVECRPR